MLTPDEYKQQVSLHDSKVETEHYRKARLDYNRFVFEQKIKFWEFSKEYGTLAVKHCFILNAGAMIAILGYLGATSSRLTAETVMINRIELCYPLYFYTAGLFFALACSVIAYINWMLVIDNLPSNEKLHNFSNVKEQKWPEGNNRSTSIDFTTNAAIFLGVLSGIFFGMASIDAANILTGSTSFIKNLPLLPSHMFAMGHPHA